MRIILRGTSAMVLAFLAFGCEIAASPDRDKIIDDSGSAGLPDASDGSQPESATPETGGPEAGETSIASCTNNVKDGEETAVDCGGKCLTRCDDGAACKVGDDCKNGVCKGGQCKAPSCNDQVKNGTETDLDCGGSCVVKCGPLKGCATPSDCLDGVCTNGKCAAAGCTDQMQNGLETDVDCGGGECDPCADTLKCSAEADCLSGFCDPGAKVCNAADCGNGHKDANETDLDCGGSCTVKCAPGKGCSSAIDCVDEVCDTNANPPVCVAGSCADQVQNGDETDVDCGGSCSDKCQETKSCIVDGDCVSAHCSGGVCVTVSCLDTQLNGDETDVDCGGSCQKCADGLLCKVAADCSSLHCADAGGSLKCIAATCSDTILNQDETDTDCGGQSGCDPCADGLACAVAGDCVTGHQCDPSTMTCVECTTTDHCQAVNALPACVAGKCTIGACSQGFGDCGGGYADGCETDTGSTPAHCGGCAQACSGNNIATTVCTAGLCTGACNAGFDDCNDDKLSDGCEADLQTSTTHCGACGVACATGFVCSAGSCICDTDDDCTNGGTCNNQSRCRCGNTTCEPGQLCTTANTCGN